MTKEHQSVFTEQFAEKWQPLMNEIAGITGLKSILVMESLTGFLKVAASAGPFENVFTKGSMFEKGLYFNKHKLYCEQVLQTNKEFYVPDSSKDPEWVNNEDYLQFGLGTYLGFPLHHIDEIIGTVCALHDQPYDFRNGDRNAYDRLKELRDQVEKDINR